MKTILTITILFLSLALSAQQVTIKWTKTNGKTGSSRIETFDLQTGSKGVRAPFKLGVEVNGEMLTGTKAFKYLKSINFTLPDYTPQVDQYIRVAAYPFYSMDTLPTTEQPKGYECRLASGGLWQGASLESLSMWKVMGVTEWRPFNPGSSPIFKEENPLWQPTEELRAMQREQYTQIISEVFTQLGTYYFPALEKTADKWYYNGEEIPVDPSHWLYGSGWIKVLKPVQIIKSWDGYTTASIHLTGNQRIKKLLGLK